MGEQPPSKTELFFYFLKKSAGTRDVVDKETAQRYFKHTTELYTSIKKLENLGAVRKIMDVAGDRRKIAQLRLLSADVSIPQGKRGRKPKTQKTGKETPAKKATNFHQPKKSRLNLFLRRP